MQMDRNLNDDGKGKYALVRLRGIEKGDEAYQLLCRLAELGHVDWGCRGETDEFFVIKLKDIYAAPALEAYADAALRDAGETGDKGTEIWSYQVRGLAERAKKHPDLKRPD